MAGRQRRRLEDDDDGDDSADDDSETRSQGSQVTNSIRRDNGKRARVERDSASQVCNVTYCTDCACNVT